MRAEKKSKKKLTLVKKIMACCLSIFTFSMASANENVNHYDDSTPKVAIIIDDVGYNLEMAKRFLEFDQKLTISILPSTPHAKTIAEIAPQYGKDVMLHLPMESVRGVRLGRLGLTQSMSKDTFIKTLQKAINSLPNITGISNHMGSLMTQDVERMNWLMEELSYYDYFYLDSKTTTDTASKSAAEKHGVAHIERSIFIDNTRTTRAIAKAYKKLMRKAKKNGYAIGIAHPRGETYDYLRSMLPKSENMFGVQFVTMSTLVKSLIAEPAY